MRTRLLALTSLVAAACRPPTAVAPDSPLVASEPAPPTHERPPTPAPAPAPAPTWAWALSVLPALADHSELDPGEAALAGFLRWFAGGEPARVYLLSEDACHASDGAMNAEGYHGSWQREVSVVGGERRVTGMSLDITVSGITQSGPGGVIDTRDRKGRWQEAGGFGTGWFGTVVDRTMTAADDRQVTFGPKIAQSRVPGRVVAVAAPAGGHARGSTILWRARGGGSGGVSQRRRLRARAAAAGDRGEAIAATRMIGVGAPMAVDPALLRGRVRAGKLAGP